MVQCEVRDGVWCGVVWCVERQLWSLFGRWGADGREEREVFILVPSSKIRATEFDVPGDGK